MAQSRLHLLCGKVASGKSTLAAQLAEAENTVLISEDVWLSALFGDQMRTLTDYVTMSAKLRGVLGPHIESVLQAGTCVVLDFAANTPVQRQWMRQMIENTGVDHRLHVLNPSDDICKARLLLRNEAGEHPFTVSEAQFDQITRYFVLPVPSEGFHVEIHGVTSELRPPLDR